MQLLTYAQTKANESEAWFRNLYSNSTPSGQEMDPAYILQLPLPGVHTGLFPHNNICLSAVIHHHTLRGITAD